MYNNIVKTGLDIPSFYSFPTQVAFWDEESECWLGGIANGEFIICGECGSTIELTEVPAMIELAWTSISDEILGSTELPKLDFLKKK